MMQLLWEPASAVAGSPRNFVRTVFRPWFWSGKRWYAISRTIRLPIKILETYQTEGQPTQEDLKINQSKLGPGTRPMRRVPCGSRTIWNTPITKSNVLTGCVATMWVGVLSCGGDIVTVGAISILPPTSERESQWISPLDIRISSLGKIKQRPTLECREKI